MKTMEISGKTTNERAKTSVKFEEKVSHTLFSLCIHNSFQSKRRITEPDHSKFGEHYCLTRTNV